MKRKLIKFGTIYEDENGQLVCDGFSVESEDMVTEYAILTLAKERIEKEIIERELQAATNGQM